MPRPGPDLQRLGVNPHGRDLVIGDIHGHFSRVARELERIGFAPQHDRLICVGDLVDRGPESELAAEWLAQPWFFATLGNHDASVLNRFGLLGAKFELWRDYHDWLPGLGHSLREHLLEQLAELPWALEVATPDGGRVGVVHAEVPLRFDSWSEFVAALGDDEIRSLASSSRTLARQALDLGAPGAELDCRLPDVHWVIHGHTPRPGCAPGQLGNRLWIDTLGWYEQSVERGTPRFTIVDINDPLTPL